MDALKKELTELLDAFAKVQMGIPLTSFAMVGFRGMVLMALDKCEKRNGIQKLDKKIRELPKKEDKDNAGRN